MKNSFPGREHVPEDGADYVENCCHCQKGLDRTEALDEVPRPNRADDSGKSPSGVGNSCNTHTRMVPSQLASLLLSANVSLQFTPNTIA